MDFRRRKKQLGRYSRIVCLIFRLFEPKDTKSLSFLVFLVVVGGCMPFTQKQGDPLDILFPHERISNFNSIDFDEPSGIVFHAQRGTLFIVGDEGDLAEIKPDGSLVQKGEIKDTDFEGITYNPATGLLYAVTESKARIIEINPNDFDVLRVLVVDPVFEDEEILKSKKNHVEAITFVPNPDQPEGGTFFLTNSQNEEVGKAAASTIFEVIVPLQNHSAENATAKIINVFPLKVMDLSGLDYDPANDHLYVISDTTNTFLEITRNGEVLKAYAFPGKNQEGVSVDSEGFLYFVQDSGGINKVKWLQENSQ
jgi:uncharacterized protein YjiK